MSVFNIDFSNVDFLTRLGIEIWHPRLVRHPYMNRQPVKLDIQPLKFKVKCMVVLPMFMDLPDAPQDDERMIPWMPLLYKMLKVLELSADELAIARIYNNYNYNTNTNTDTDTDIDTNTNVAFSWEHVVANILLWKPQFLLQFAVDFPLCMTAERAVSTLHPKHLLECPHDKNIAYRDLLSLKLKLKA